MVVSDAMVEAAREAYYRSDRVEPDAMREAVIAAFSVWEPSDVGPTGPVPSETPVDLVRASQDEPECDHVWRSSFGDTFCEKCNQDAPTGVWCRTCKGSGTWCDEGWVKPPQPCQACSGSGLAPIRERKQDVTGVSSVPVGETLRADGCDAHTVSFSVASAHGMQRARCSCGWSTPWQSQAVHGSDQQVAARRHRENPGSAPSMRDGWCDGSGRLPDPSEHWPKNTRKCPSCDGRGCNVPVQQDERGICGEVKIVEPRSLAPDGIQCVREPGHESPHRGPWPSGNGVYSWSVEPPVPVQQEPELSCAECPRTFRLSQHGERSQSAEMCPQCVADLRIEGRAGVTPVPQEPERPTSALVDGGATVKETPDHLSLPVQQDEPEFWTCTVCGQERSGSGDWACLVGNEGVMSTRPVLCRRPVPVQQEPERSHTEKLMLSTQRDQRAVASVGQQEPERCVVCGETQPDSCGACIASAVPSVGLRDRCYRAALDAHPWRVAGETKAVVDTVLSVLHEAGTQDELTRVAEEAARRAVDEYGEALRKLGDNTTTSASSAEAGTQGDEALRHLGAVVGAALIHSDKTGHDISEEVAEARAFLQSARAIPAVSGTSGTKEDA